MKLQQNARFFRLLLTAGLLAATACQGSSSDSSGASTSRRRHPDYTTPAPAASAVPAQSGEPVLYAADNFDGQTFSPLWTSAGCDEELYAESNVLPWAYDEEHGDVLHYFIPAGVDEVSPVQLSLEGNSDFERVTGKENIDEFYAEWSEYFPEEHDFADIGQKLLRLTYWREDEEHGAELTFAVLNNNSRMQLFLYHPYGGVNGEVVDEGHDMPPIPVGRWVRLGVWAKLNTPGEADGFIAVYVDGEMILAQDHMSIRGSDSRGWNIMWLGGNHSNHGQTERASSRYIDDFLWYSTKPG